MEKKKTNSFQRRQVYHDLFTLKHLQHAQPSGYSFNKIFFLLRYLHLNVLSVPNSSNGHILVVGRSGYFTPKMGTDLRGYCASPPYEAGSLMYQAYIWIIARDGFYVYLESFLEGFLVHYILFMSAGVCPAPLHTDYFFQAAHCDSNTLKFK